MNYVGTIHWQCKVGDRGPCTYSPSMYGNLLYVVKDQIYEVKKRLAEFADLTTFC